MKNNKAVDLLKKGLSHQTISKLTESQINTLHSRLVSEQVTKVTGPDSYVIKNSGSLTTPMPKGATVTKKPDGSVMVTPNEGEIGEAKSKKKEQDPFAICTSQLGKEFGTTKRSMWSAKETNKYERCVKDVKKSLKEGKNPVSLFLENQIMRLVEKHIPPRITKGDLIKYLSEDTTTAPAKPKPTTNPGAKPGAKPTTRPRPSHPGKNPNPNENPAPKAVSPEKAKEEVIDLILNILSK
jgi:hypothetical protein